MKQPHTVVNNDFYYMQWTHEHSDYDLYGLINHFHLGSSQVRFHNIQRSCFFIIRHNHYMSFPLAIKILVFSQSALFLLLLPVTQISWITLRFLVWFLTNIIPSKSKTKLIMIR